MKPRTQMFIGGPWAGKFYAHDYSTRDLYVPVLSNPPDFITDNPDEPTSINYVQYTERELHINGHTLKVWAVSNMTDWEMIGQLFDAYQRVHQPIRNSG